MEQYSRKAVCDLLVTKFCSSRAYSRYFRPGAASNVSVPSLSTGQISILQRPIAGSLHDEGDDQDNDRPHDGIEKPSRHDAWPPASVASTPRPRAEPA